MLYTWDPLWGPRVVVGIEVQDAHGYNASATLLPGTLDGTSADKLQLVAYVELVLRAQK